MGLEAFALSSNTELFNPILDYQYKAFFLPTATVKLMSKLCREGMDSVDKAEAAVNTAAVTAASFTLSFNQISGISNKTEVYDYHEGGNNGYLRQFPGLTSAGQITLSHGLSREPTMALLRNMVAGSRGSSRFGTFAMMIGFFGQDMIVPTFWYFTGCMASLHRGWSLNAGDGSRPPEVIMESLTLVVKKAELEILKAANMAKTV